jgi:hypothetical protein
LVSFATTFPISSFIASSSPQFFIYLPAVTITRNKATNFGVLSYLFILCAEILAILIKQNKNIKGICINNTEYKISQYADDTSLALDGSPQSLFCSA